jgi:hypothetical protein
MNALQDTEVKKIMDQIVKENTGGYFYLNNCRINYSEEYGWYCKDFINKKMKTYNITKEEAYNKIASS